MIERYSTTEMKRYGRAFPGEINAEAREYCIKVKSERLPPSRDDIDFCGCIDSVLSAEKDVNAYCYDSRCQQESAYFTDKEFAKGNCTAPPNCDVAQKYKGLSFKPEVIAACPGVEMSMKQRAVYVQSMMSQEIAIVFIAFIYFCVWLISDGLRAINEIGEKYEYSYKIRNNVRSTFNIQLFIVCTL